MPPPATYTLPLYRRFFTPEECAELDASSTADITPELSLLRLLMTRVLAVCQRATEITLPQHAAVVTAFCIAGKAIARLVQLRDRLMTHWHRFSTTEILSAFYQALPAMRPRIPAPVPCTQLQFELQPQKGGSSCQSDLAAASPATATPSSTASTPPPSRNTSAAC